jgi:hypothetical protein
MGGALPYFAFLVLQVKVVPNLYKNAQTKL